MAPLHYKNAFTLIELLVSISIIAIISALALPNFMGAREKARDSAKVSDMDAVKNALRLYYNVNQSFPTGPTLGAEMTPYLPAILNLGYTYSYLPSADKDRFCLKVVLESGQGDEDINSQLKCGVPSNTLCGVGQTTDKLFVICSN